MKKRAIGLFLMCCLLLSLTPTGGFAVEDVEQNNEAELMSANKLPAPTNVRWETGYQQYTQQYVYNGSNRTRVCNTTPGWISWERSDTAVTRFDTNLYNSSNKLIGETKWLKTSSLTTFYEDTFLYDILESGDYYFTVQAINPNDESLNSEIVRSDTWTYTKPNITIATPTNLQMDGNILRWDCDPNAEGYYIEWYYSSRETGGEEYSGHFSDTSGNPLCCENIVSKIVEDDGYYHVRVRSISKDITKKCHSGFTNTLAFQVKDGNVVANSGESGGNGTYTPTGSVIDSGYCGGEGDGKNLTWEIYSDGSLMISGTGEMRQYFGDAPWRNYGNTVHSVIIGDGVTTLASGSLSFQNSDAMSYLQLPDSLIRIEEGSLGDSNNLDNIFIPKNVSEIEGAALIGENLVITIDPDNPYYMIKDGAVLTKDGKTFVQAPGPRYFHPEGTHFIRNQEEYKQYMSNAYTIPSSVTTIGKNAFYSLYAKNIGFSSITIPESVKRIEAGAFANVGHVFSNNDPSNSTVRITLPNGLEYVGAGAFDVPKSDESWAYSISNMVKYEDAYYLGNSSNPYLLLVEEDQRYDDRSQQRIHPNTKVLADYALKSLSNLKNVYFYGSEDDFRNIVNQWKEFNSDRQFHLVSNGSVIKSVIGLGFCGINTGSATSGSGSASGGGGSSSGGGGGSPVEIKYGKNVFWEVYPDRSLVISGNGDLAAFINGRDYQSGPWNNIWWQDGDGYSGANRIQKLVINNGITSIPPNVFSDMPLISATIPSSVKTIADEAFKDNDQLPSISIPEGVESIGASAFAGCCSLTSITIPNSVRWLGENAFADCDRLTSVKMGTNITTEYDGIGSPFSRSPIDTVTFTCTQSGNKRIPARLFMYFNTLSTVIIAEGVETIGENAFNKCDALKSVNIPSSLNEIGANAFRECDSLTSLLFQDKQDESGDSLIIREGAFSYCDGLTTLTLPNTAVQLENEAFAYCNNLSTLKMGIDVSAWFTSPFTQTPISTVYLTYCNKPNAQTNVPSRYISGVLDNEGTTNIYIGDGGSSVSSNSYKNSVSTIIVSPGFTKIEKNAFSDCGNLTAVYIPKSVQSISPYCLDKEWAGNVDVYYAGSRSAWILMNIFGNDAASPLDKARIHFGESNYIPRIVVNTSSGTTKLAPAVLEFDSGVRGGIYLNSTLRPKIDTGWSFDLFRKKASQYRGKLAVTALVLAANAYDMHLEEQTLQKLGFGKILSYDPANMSDINQVGFSIASAKKEINGKYTNVITVVCRGSANIPDWVSNLMVQANGFRSAAQRVKESLDQYISDNKIDTSKPTKLFITGHSRGAAVANILGTIVSDITDNDNVYVYTFACPNTTTEDNRRSYHNIFNFSNSADPVPGIPPMLFSLGSNKFGICSNFDNFESNSRFSTAFYEVAGVSSIANAYIFSQPSLYTATNMIGHTPAVYMACLLSDEISEEFSVTVGKDYWIKTISIKCPVDVAVYNSMNQLLGTITNNVPSDDLLANGVYVRVEGDEKYLYTASGLELRLELTGTNTGKMTYSVEEINTTTGETISEQTFSNVVLTEGKEMSSTVANDIAVPDTQLFVLSGNEVAAEVSTNGSEQEVVLLSFDTDLGDPLRDMSVPKGSAVGELPVAHMEGYLFDGWYVDESLAEPFDQSANLTKSTTLYAKYKEAYDVYAEFSSIVYDGSAVTATLEYDYNNVDSMLFVALYKDGQMQAIVAADVREGASVATVEMPISELFGLYQMKAFFLGDGRYVPINGGAEASFYAN